MTAGMNPVEMITFALSERRTAASDQTGSVTVEVTADGAIHSIRLSESGRRMAAEQVAEMITRLHRTALTEAQRAIDDLVAGLDDGSAEPPADDVPIQTASPLPVPPGSPATHAHAEQHPAATGASVSTPPGEAPPSTTPPAPLSPLSMGTGQSRTPPPTVPSVSTPTVPPPVRPGTTHGTVSHDREDDDDDEYYRNFHIIQEDDHLPRPGQKDHR